jgi:tetratricopeptide (TPR) repeat protein
MKLLREVADKAISGEGGVVFLYGEAGIGKTRLTRELGAYARLRGMQVLSGRCPALFRMDGVPPYILWSEVIKDYLHYCTPEQLYKVIGLYPGELLKLVPEIRQKFRILPESLPINPEHGRDRLFEEVSQFVTNISREAPLLVILDDLQWTDQTSLLLLHYLARGVYRESLLLLGAYRDSEVDEQHPLTPVLTELNRERLLQSAQLKRMSFDDTSEMIKRVLEQDDVPREFCQLVYEKTRGNPFFAEEVIKSLKEEEVINREGNKWKIKDVSKVEFPKTVKNVIKARVGRLDEECQNVLMMASFVGNDFTVEAMSAVTGIEESKLLRLMDKLFKTGLIKEQVARGEGICSFADLLVRDVVYEEVTPLTRKELHGVVASALEKVYAETIDEHSGELASHFLESGQKDKALNYFLKAGERASKVYANSEAASYYQSALSLLEEKGDELREKGRVLERLGDIKRLVGEYDACMKYWSEALPVWKQLDEKETVARLHRKMAHALWSSKGDTEKAKVHHEEALKILEKEPESVELARLFDDIANLYIHAEDATKARSWVEKALGIAERLDAHEVIAECCISFASILGVSGGQMKKAAEFCERALSIALEKGYMETALVAYNNLASSLPVEEAEKGFELIERGFDLAKKVGAVRNTSWLGTNLALSYAWMGDLNRAVPLAEESAVLDRKAGDMNSISFSTNILGFCYQSLGEWDKSERYYIEALDLAQKAKSTQQIFTSYFLLGRLYLERDEYAKSREQFEKAIETCEKAGAKYYLMRFVYAWGAIQTYIELEETEKAQSLIDDMLKFAEERKDKEIIAYSDALKATLLRAQGKWKESIELFEKSIEEFDALNLRRWVVYFFAKMIPLEYARTYLERNEEGDKEKARDLLNQALEIFQKMGAKKDIEKVEARIAFIETGKVVSKPKGPELVSTGVADLDKLLCGGLPSGYSVVLASPSCDERDLLVKSFLETGAKRGEVTLYLTIDPGAAKGLAEEYRSNFSLIVCNPQADVIVEDAPNVIKLKGVENLTEIGIALTSAIRRAESSPKGSRRLCIGLISDVLLQHHNVQTRRWLTGLIPELRSAGFTTLAVLDPEMHPSQDVRAVLDLFEGEIDVLKKETEKGPTKHLKIQKMSNQKYLEDELPLKKEQP